MERRIEKVKSLWKKYTSYFTVTLLFTSLPIQVKAEESENPSNSEVSEEIEKQQTNQEDTLIENSGEESENKYTKDKIQQKNLKVWSSKVKMKVHLQMERKNSVLTIYT